MKELKTLLTICDEINAAYSAEEEANHIPPTGSACVCDDNGGPLSLADEHQVEGKLRLIIDIHKWSEGTKPLTQSGRKELKAEHDAICRIHAKAEQFGSVDITGSGTGEYGPIDCYELTPHE